MKYTIKRYTIEKINDYDNCKQTNQLTLNGNYFVNSPKEGIINCFMQEYNCEYSSIYFTYTELSDIYDGKIDKIQKPFLLPNENEDIKTLYIEMKNKGYFDITDMRKVDNYYEVYKDGDGLVIKFYLKNLNRTVNDKIECLPLQDDDICFAIIGSIYKDLKFGGTKDVFLTPLVNDLKDLDSYINNMDNEIKFIYDNIEIEVFSRSHITQMNWYKRSMEKLVLPDNDKEERE